MSAVERLGAGMVSLVIGSKRETRLGSSPVPTLKASGNEVKVVAGQQNLTMLLK